MVTAVRTAELVLVIRATEMCTRMDIQILRPTTATIVIRLSTLALPTIRVTRIIAIPAIRIATRAVIRATRIAIHPVTTRATHLATTPLTPIATTELR